MTTVTLELLKEYFCNVDQSSVDFIKTVLYDDGWASYEENGHLVVFEGTDEKLYMFEYGYCVYQSINDRAEYCPTLVTHEEAIKEMSEMDEYIASYSLGG